MMDSFTKLPRDAKETGDKLVMVSLYDALSAALSCDAGGDMILVGDSLGNAVVGYENPLRVTDGRHAVASHGGIAAGCAPPWRPAAMPLPFAPPALPFGICTSLTPCLEERCGYCAA